MTENRTAQAATEMHAAGTDHRAADRALARGDYRTAVLDLDSARVHASNALILVVRAWRGTGASWQDIGDALGITRQAAWSRFASNSPLNS